MKAFGRWVLILAVLIGLILLGGVAGRFFLLLGMLALRLLLGVCVVALLWVGWLFLKAALTASAQQSQNVQE